MSAPSQDPARPTAASGRDAQVASFVSALRAAATPSADDRAHARKVEAMERVVADAPRDRRAHVAALLEAALEREARERASIGLPRREDRLFRGWIDLPSVGAPPGEGTDDLDGWGATGAADDVDLALARTTTIVRELLRAPDDDERARLWDEFEAAAFTPCFGTSASCRGGFDRRRPLIILWLALRRKRPIAAAVLRRCISLDRCRRAAVARLDRGSPAGGEAS